MNVVGYEKYIKKIANIAEVFVFIKTKFSYQSICCKAPVYLHKSWPTLATATNEPMMFFSDKDNLEVKC